jgi:glycosyltransferase involved in cell wall biosynthesis
MEIRGVELSVVSPVYQAAEAVDQLVSRIAQAAQKITSNFEIILVDDRSIDESWARIVLAARSDPRIRGARLSRNVGQHAAITAALSLARGQRVIVMDCDLQHDPAAFPQLWEKANQGFDVVLAYDDARQHARHRNLGARAFRLVNTWLSGREQPECSLGTYSLLSRKVVDAFLQYRETHRHYHHILRSAGFNVGRVKVDHQMRLAGSSSYDFRKLVRHAIHGMLGQSDRLLYGALFLGFICCVAALVGVGLVLERWLIGGLLPGWASLVVVQLASTGITLFTLGVIGIYIGGIFEQVRSRPLFLIDQTTDKLHD